MTVWGFNCHDSHFDVQILNLVKRHCSQKRKTHSSWSVFVHQVFLLNVFKKRTDDNDRDDHHGHYDHDVVVDDDGGCGCGWWFYGLVLLSSVTIIIIVLIIIYISSVIMTVNHDYHHFFTNIGIIIISLLSSAAAAASSSSLVIHHYYSHHCDNNDDEDRQWFIGFLRGGCSRGRGNWGTLRIPREDWGTLGKISGITTPLKNPINDAVHMCQGLKGDKLINPIVGVYIPIITRWWFQIFFTFTPNLGEMIQFDEHIFRMGWFNHQLDKDSRH